MKQGHVLAALACVTVKEGRRHVGLFHSPGLESSRWVCGYGKQLWCQHQLHDPRPPLWQWVPDMRNYRGGLRSPPHLDGGKGSKSPGRPAQRYFSGSYFWKTIQGSSSLALLVPSKHLIPCLNFFLLRLTQVVFGWNTTDIVFLVTSNSVCFKWKSSHLSYLALTSDILKYCHLLFSFSHFSFFHSQSYPSKYLSLCVPFLLVLLLASRLDITSSQTWNIKNRHTSEIMQA